jgi:hypothetical protein
VNPRLRKIDPLSDDVGNRGELRRVSKRPLRRLPAFSIVAMMIIAAFAWSWRASALRTMGRVLTWEDPIRPVDVIVVPSWSGEAGALEAADLVHRGIGRRVAVILTAPSPAQRVLIARGIIQAGEHSWPVSLLHLLGIENVETIESLNGSESESAEVPRWCVLKGISSAAIVTTTDHSRRVHRLFERNPARNIRFIIVSSRYSTFDPDVWWKSRAGIRTETVELEKLALDIARHPFN